MKEILEFGDAKDAEVLLLRKHKAFDIEETLSMTLTLVRSCLLEKY